VSILVLTMITMLFISVKGWCLRSQNFVLNITIGLCASKVSQDSSVSIMSRYGLDDRAIEVRSPSEGRDFSSSLCVQTGSGAHPASCTVGTGVLSPRLKRGRSVTLTTYPHLVPVS
jgi:hypothetical protein